MIFVVVLFREMEKITGNFLTRFLVYNYVFSLSSNGTKLLAVTEYTDTHTYILLLMQLMIWKHCQRE